jgi:hypothetical protein
MSHHVDDNPDTDVVSEGAGGRDAGYSDNENSGRAQSKQMKEKADPTLVPKSGAHWQHDSRGDGAASTGRGGGRGRRLFEAGERGGKMSGGRTEERWQHDKFSELASSSGTSSSSPSFPPPPPYLITPSCRCSAGFRQRKRPAASSFLRHRSCPRCCHRRPRNRL